MYPETSKKGTSSHASLLLLIERDEIQGCLVNTLFQLIVI